MQTCSCSCIKPSRTRILFLSNIRPFEIKVSGGTSGDAYRAARPSMERATGSSDLHNLFAFKFRGRRDQPDFTRAFTSYSLHSRRWLCFSLSDYALYPRVNLRIVRRGNLLKDRRKMCSKIVDLNFCFMCKFSHGLPSTFGFTSTSERALDSV